MGLKCKTLLLGLAMILLLGTCHNIMAQDGIPAISLKDARLDDVVRMLAEQAKINLVLTKEIDKKVTLQLKDSIPPLKLLEVVCNEHGYLLVKKENIYTLEERRKETSDKSEPGMNDKLGISEVKSSEKNYFQLLRTPVEQVEAKIKSLLSFQGRMEINREANAVLIFDNPENVGKVKEYVDFLNLDPSSALEARLQERTFKVNRLSPDSVEETIKGMLTPEKGKVTFDKKSMTLVVRDKEEVLNKIAQFLGAADQPEPQVYIRCHVVEVTLDANTGTGFSFESEGWKLDDLAMNPTYFNALPSSYSSTMGIGLRSPNDDFSAKMSATANRNNARLLSSPNLLCANKLTSKIEVTQDLPYTTSELDKDTNTITVTVAFKEAGIKLDVTPDIYADGTVKMLLKGEVSAKISDFTYTANGISNIVPVLKKKIVESNVIAKDRQTIVIGGILEDSIRKTRFKVPLLGDIPLLGLLFGSEVQEMVKTELLIFMNITIVNEEYLKNMANHEWKAQQEKFDKFDTEFEFYPHLKQKLEMDKLNPQYDKK
ncbi:MAG: hypothetical protein HUU50_11385 [Candidatus Brocadiae bacterium]|nr:hypothetical protein [Candidatus Brocadiia bacterium]